MGKTLVIKLGSEQNGWLPSEKHYNDIKYKLIQSGVLKNFDGYIITHFGTKFEIIDTDKMKFENPEDYLKIIYNEKEELKSFEKEDYGPIEGIIPTNLEGLQFNLTKSGIGAAVGYLSKCRYAKEVDDRTLVDSILYLAYQFGKKLVSSEKLKDTNS